MKLRYSESEYYTHQPILLATLMASRGPVLELGCGEGSTPLIHEICQQQGREVLTIDNNREWFGKYNLQYSATWHRFIFAHDWTAVLTDDLLDRAWGVVFVDQSPWEARHLSIRIFGGDAEYLVLHDCDYFPENGVFGKCIRPILNENDPGERDYSEYFQYWREIFPPKPWKCRTGPPTLLASNNNPVDSIEVQW